MNDTPAEQAVAQLRQRTAELAQAVVARHYGRSPELAERYGTAGRDRCLEDAEYHLRYLAEAVEAASPVLFVDYISWARVVLEERNVGTADLKANLECLSEELDQQLGPEQAAPLHDALQAGLDQLQHTPPTPPSPLRSEAQTYLDHLLAGNRAGAVQLIHDTVGRGVSIQDLYLNVFQPVQYEIGRLWQVNKISVAQEHYCTAVTQLAMSQLYPQLVSGERSGGVLVCAAIGGDLHEIGSRMIADFFELEGWDTYYLGASTPVAGIVQQVVERRADVVALSATMTYHLPKLREAIEAVRAAVATRILVGGRPFRLDAGLWKQLNADGWAEDARQAVAVAQAWRGRGGAA